MLTNFSRIVLIFLESTQRCRYWSSRSWMKDLASGGDLYPALSCFSSLTFISITNSRTWDSSRRKSWWGSLVHNLKGKLQHFIFHLTTCILKICHYNTSKLWAMWSGGKKVTCELSLERTRHLEHSCPLHTNLPHVSHITSAQVSVTLSNNFVALEFLCHGLSQFVLKMR